MNIYLSLHLRALNLFHLCICNHQKEKPWAARLLSIACLSLAAKMEEYRAPNLSEYRSDGCEFSADSIQRMELLVLSTLDWRMSCISPFDYIRFFASQFDHDHGSDGLMIRAVQFVLSSLAGTFAFSCALLVILQVLY